MIPAYHLLDIATTLANCLALYLIASTLCKKGENSYLRLVPYLYFFAVTYVWTWWIDNVTWKMPFIILTTGFVLKLCLGESIYPALSCLLLLYAVVIAAECVSILICSGFVPSVSVVVEGKQFMVWQVYLLSLTLQLMAAGLLRLLLSRSKYTIRFRDFLVILATSPVVVFFWLRFLVPFLHRDETWLNLPGQAITACLSLIFLVQFLYIKNYYALRDKSREDQATIDRLQRQYAYYRDKQQEETRIRSIYHDLKNHLLVFQAQEDDGRKTARAISGLQSRIEGYEHYQHTGNDFLDVILRDKAGLAQEKQIDFTAAVQAGDSSFIEPLDISTIFGNALDNAIEASEKLPPEERIVTVRAGRIQDMFSICVVNNASPSADLSKGTSKTDSFAHGFGLPNIRKAVEKYGGQCSIKAANGVFSLNIVIPIPDGDRGLPS